MDLSLVRTEFRPDGIFSELRDVSGDVIAVTLEHAYFDPLGAPLPKLVDGSYQCVRGKHFLTGMTAPLETFEITDVPNHTGILFHIGNFNIDSEGCVLVGMAIAQIGGRQAIAQSKLAFQKFMNFQTGYDEFTLTVKSS